MPEETPLEERTPPPADSPAPEPTPPPSAPRSGGSGATLFAAGAIAVVVALFVGLGAGFLGARLATSDSSNSKTARVTVIPAKTDEPVAAASAAALPSVVNIDVRGASADEGLPSTHPGVPSLSNGSGVAYKQADESGTYILTNNHVVEDATSITVRDGNGRSTVAKLVGRDPETDIAVLKVTVDIPAISVGDSAKLIVGQTVIAIGSPFGLEHTVTSGVISALGRSLPDFIGAPEDGYPLVDVIQTDAPINPGNSGGALVDRAGTLIGVNTAIYSDTGASGGIGFAIPVNTAIRVADQLIKGGEVAHPFLGIIGQTVTKEFAAQEKLDVEEGAWVADVVIGSGAQKAGIKSGDVITGLDDDPIRSMDDLILQVRRKTVGDKVVLKVRRGAKNVMLTMTVGDKPETVVGEQEKKSRETTGSNTPTSPHQ